jgi:hypothetical protein
MPEIASNGSQGDPSSSQLTNTGMCPVQSGY